MTRHTGKPGFERLGFEFPEWYLEAPCSGQGDLMFDTEREAEAKAVCRDCPFRKECLILALENQEEFGVWGGYSPSDRKDME